YMETLQGIFRWVLPIAVAWAVLNVFDLEMIQTVLKYYLVMSFLVYLLLHWHDLFSIQSYLNMSFSLSSSAFESNYFSPTSIALFLFFCYFDKRKIYKYIGAVYVILTFKRPMIVCMIIMLIFGSWFKRKSKTSTKKIYVFLLTVGLLLLIWFLIGLFSGKFDDLFYRVTGTTVSAFTKWRSNRVTIVMNMDYVKSGLGSITSVYRLLELDLVQYYMEMGVLSVIIVVINVMRLAKRNLFNIAMCVFCVAELITSHWYDITYFWIVWYITLGCISYKSGLDYAVEDVEKRIVFKIGKIRMPLRL
ncbi:MAG: hypothetical protein LUC91_03865, partial [Prevotella sp.]|nr:hypothetical protein [Prevotella sp.]